MKNKILILVLGVALVPSIASAAWWNPVSWFKNEPRISTSPPSGSEQEIPESDPLNLFNDKPPVTGPKVVEKQVIKEVPVEKVVEKVVQVKDQSVVDENTALKQKVKELQAKLDQLTTDLTKAQARIKELEAPITQKEAQKKAYLVSIANLDLEIAKTEAGLYDSQLCWNEGCQQGQPEGREGRVNLLKAQKAAIQLDLQRLQ